jgi:perosamine synthetase
MTDNFVPVNIPLLGGKELDYVSECIKSGWISSEGPFVAEFETKMAARVNRKHGVAVANGSAALDIAVAALGITKGDEVIMPAHTIISCAAAIIHAGATPVLVDSNPQTWNMEISQIEAKITPKTKAIMVVHLYGLPVDIEPIITLAKKHHLAIIEDAAQMIGQTYKGQPCGSFGDISTFSFYPNKHITTGEGGMCLTNDPELAERCRSYRNLCFQRQKRFVHEELGWNYRITNLQAALGLAQLEQLDKHVTIKRAIGNKYQTLLADTPNIQLPLKRTDYAENIYWVFGLVLNESLTLEAEEVMKQLAKKGIGCRPFFWSMHEQPVFNKMGLFQDEKYPVSEKLGRRGFYIPSGLGLTKEQMEKTIVALKTLLLT